MIILGLFVVGFIWWQVRVWKNWAAFKRERDELLNGLIAGTMSKQEAMARYMNLEKRLNLAQRQRYATLIAGIQEPVTIVVGRGNHE